MVSKSMGVASIEVSDIILAIKVLWDTSDLISDHCARYDEVNEGCLKAPWSMEIDCGLLLLLPYHSLLSTVLTLVLLAIPP